MRSSLFRRRALMKKLMLKMIRFYQNFYLLWRDILIVNTHPHVLNTPMRPYKSTGVWKDYCWQYGDYCVVIPLLKADMILFPRDEGRKNLIQNLIILTKNTSNLPLFGPIWNLIVSALGWIMNWIYLFLDGSVFQTLD